MNIPAIASSKFLYRFLNPKISNQFSVILIIVQSILNVIMPTNYSV